MVKVTTYYTMKIVSMLQGVYNTGSAYVGITQRLISSRPRIDSNHLEKIIHESSVLHRES